MVRRIVLLVGLGVLAACASERAPSPRGKPVAPVDVALTARPLAGDAYAVTLTARPTRDVPSLELMLDGRRVDAGPTRRGEARTLTAEVRLGAARGREVAGAARAGGRSRAAVVALGEVTAPPRATRRVTLPDGVVVEEVRP